MRSHSSQFSFLRVLDVWIRSRAELVRMDDHQLIYATVTNAIGRASTQ
jgi:hypothetical protein